MRRIVLLGQAPSRTSTAPFEGRCGDRICMLAGIPSLADAFDPVNLLERWPGKDGKGDAFPAAGARRAAARMMPHLDARTVVFAGRNVASAFRFAAPYLRWRRHQVFVRSLGGFYEVRAAVLPHPSGVNLWYNDPKNVRRARRFLRAEVARACSRRK